MPEGPEVYALCYALTKYGLQCDSYGKHLFFNNEDWSFGLNGRVSLNGNTLIKITDGYIVGTIKPNSYSTKHLGPSWMNDDDDLLVSLVMSWKSSKKTLATLLLDQSQISGIGVAWGSELLKKSDIHPSSKACDITLVLLADSILFFKNAIKKQYTEHIDQLSREELQSFINSWFYNLYAIRTMAVYKKGKKVAVGGRSWWI